MLRAPGGAGGPQSGYAGGQAQQDPGNGKQRDGEVTDVDFEGEASIFRDQQKSK